jgi:septum formation topological specificity factor MinE
MSKAKSRGWKFDLIVALTAAMLGCGTGNWCLGDGRKEAGQPGRDSTSKRASGQKLDFTGGGIWIGPEATELEVQAAKELQSFLYSISQKKLAIRKLANGKTDGRPAIIVGTVKSLSKFTGDFPKQVARLEKGSNEAFDLCIGAHKGAPTALILGNEPIGALYGAYTFLEKLGLGFYLGGDVFPGANVPLQVAEMDEFWNPALPIRGSVIWINFLNSPMTWDLEDYKYFFDQMVKMKANLVSFPEYGYGLTDYAEGGKLVPGLPLATSENYGWGTVRGMKTAEFGFGTGEFFTGPAYGSKASVEAKDDQDAIRRSQELFEQAVAYAQQRGIKVSLGFQLDGLPTDASLKDVASRLRVLVTKYPWIEYIWFWQAEAVSVDPHFTTDVAVSDQIKKQAAHFAYLKDEKRALEGGRMAVYIQEAYKALKDIAPKKRVVISGWGGDKWLRFSDLFPGLDEILPKEVVFSALDNIDPSWEPNVSQFYGKLPDDRERWAIPWWESDGGGSRHDQFMPECNVKAFSVLLPDVIKKGCKGVLGIHWRSRGVEDVAAYMMDFAWNPTNTSCESFWWDFALRCFGEADAPEMSKLLMDLEALGPRWTGGGGQAECAGFTWMADPPAPKEENLKTLQTIRQKLQVIVEHDRKAGNTQYLDRVERLINTIDWVTLYDEAAMQVLQAEAKSSQDKQAAAEMLLKAPLGKAMQVYTRLLYTRSDWGVLATVNVKAYAAFEKLYKQCIGAAVPGSDVTADLPIQVAFKEPNKIATQSEPLPVQIVATGGKSIESVKVFYRPLGEGEFVSMPMTRGFRNVYQAAIPGTAVTEKGLEYYIEVKGAGGQLFRVPKGLPSIAVTIVKPK